MVAIAKPFRIHRNTLRAFRSTTPHIAAAARRCRRKFLRFFPDGFQDETYLDWERSYKAAAHNSWRTHLSPRTFRELLDREKYQEIALRAVRIESRTNLLFSFEKMALRDAVRGPRGAKLFAEALWDHLQSPIGRVGFEKWAAAIGELPRRQTRVLTWPLATVFGFIAQPRRHIFLKPNVTRIAASQYGFEFDYRSKVAWPTYASMLRFARTVRRDQGALSPRDMIDIQGFIWVQGSDEYEE